MIRGVAALLRPTGLASAESINDQKPSGTLEPCAGLAVGAPRVVAPERAHAVITADGDMGDGGFWLGGHL